MDSQKVMVEIVAKQKGCMLCDLAIAILEEIAPEFEKEVLQWKVVDVGSREGVMRHVELGKICKRMPAVPSIGDFFPLGQSFPALYPPRRPFLSGQPIQP
jgi:hypothetical protein